MWSPSSYNHAWIHLSTSELWHFRMRFPFLARCGYGDYIRNSFSISKRQPPRTELDHKHCSSKMMAMNGYVQLVITWLHIYVHMNHSVQRKSKNSKQISILIELRWIIEKKLMKAWEGFTLEGCNLWGRWLRGLLGKYLIWIPLRRLLRKWWCQVNKIESFKLETGSMSRKIGGQLNSSKPFP